ncbi:MAG: UDP-glucose dehydrogenase family protein [Nitrososphaerales archaeon]
MKVSVVGTGYVGLTTAVCFAYGGHRVRCVDNDGSKIEKISRGVPPIFEEGMDSLLRDVVKSGLLTASTDLGDAVVSSDVSFICVGTPAGEDGRIDLSQVSDAVASIGKALKRCRGRHVVVVKSTVLPGTTEEVVIPCLEENSGLKVSEGFGVCVSPEFLREGQAISDFLNPWSTGIVIGESDRESGDMLVELFRGFEGKVLRTDLRTAEMIKYARNAYLAKDVSFANEIANICSALSVDYLDVKEGMELDFRIGAGRFLSAGIGYGGSCFKKDVTALIRKAEDIGVEPRLLKATEEVNEMQPMVAFKLVEKSLGDLAGKKVAVLGVAFKDGTDDIRESRALKLIELLLGAKSRVVVFDPKAMDNAKKMLAGKVDFAETAGEALNDCDACILATEWAELRNPDLYSKRKSLVIIDGRRIVDPDLLPADVRYYGVGHPVFDEA